MDAQLKSLDLTITRTFNAPRSLVFAAWTQGEHLARWSGPEGFTTPHSEMDLRPGGKYRACLRAPDGTDHWLQGVYKDISPPERLVMTHAWLQEDGSTSPETLVTVTLRELAPGKTEMVFHQGPFDSAPSRDGHAGGWGTSFDKLAAHLASVTAKA